MKGAGIFIFGQIGVVMEQHAKNARIVLAEVGIQLPDEREAFG